jgi:hypothetical protein
MDYMMDAMDFKGVALFVTRWTNLGAGLALIDTKWRSHVGMRMADGVIYQSHVTGSVRDGSIREGFEDQEGRSLEELTRQNI